MAEEGRWLGNRGCLEPYASLRSAQAALSGQPEGHVPIEPDVPSATVTAADEGVLDQAALCLTAAITACETCSIQRLS